MGALLNMNNFKLKLFTLLQKFKLLPNNVILTESLDLHRGGIEKQLDEYRELLENIELATGYFSSPQGEFSCCHATTLDNYLSYLYTLRHGVKPNEEKPITYLRQKPEWMKSYEYNSIKK